MKSKERRERKEETSIGFTGTKLTSLTQHAPPPRPGPSSSSPALPTATPATAPPPTLS